MKAIQMRKRSVTATRRAKVSMALHWPNSLEEAEMGRRLYIFETHGVASDTACMCVESNQ